MDSLIDLAAALIRLSASLLDRLPRRRSAGEDKPPSRPG